MDRQASPGAPEKRPSRLLVVDDSATVLRVMDFVLSQAGFEVKCLEQGREVVEVARAFKPDLVFVDFNMPEINGFEVCRLLGEDAELELIPIVVMSTRGDPVGDRFVRDMGIVDHITKPFAPEALLALVKHILRKTEEIAPGARRRRPTFLAFDPQGLRLGEEVPRPEARLAESVTAALGGLLEDATHEQAVLERLHTIFEEDTVLDDVRALLRARGGGPALAGDLGQVPLAEVMQLLSLQRQSGILTVELGDRVVSIAIKNGQVRLVTSENLSRDFLLGTILVREKLIEPRELELFLANRKGTRRRLGSQVVKLGYVTQEALERAIQRQSSELVYELLRWGSGRFEFYRRDELPEQVLEFNFAITIDELLMEGFRRVDEWGLIESVLPSFDLVPARVPGGLEHVGPQGLTPEEQAVYDEVDGERTVHQLIDQVGGAAFDVARVLYRLISARVVTVATAALAPAPASDAGTDAE